MPREEAEFALFEAHYRIYHNLPTVFAKGKMA